MMKWIIGIVVVALAAAALWWSGWLGTMTPSQTPTTTNTATTTQQTPQAQAPTNGMSANTDASDAAIGQDAAAVDAQMQGLTTDSTQVDSSLSDKSVQ
jgi:hypothetical protein